MADSLLTSWDLKRFAAYEALSITVVLLVPGYWAYLPWLAGMALLYALARRHLRLHPETPPPRTSPGWLTLLVIVGVLVMATLPARWAGISRDPGWLMVALGFAFLAEHTVDRWWAFRRPPDMPKP